MSNVFKRATKSSISNTAGTASTIYTCAANKTAIIVGCLLTNKTSSEVSVHVKLDTSIAGNDDAFLCSGLMIPGNATVELSMGKIVLTHDNTNGDVITAYASQSSAVDVILSLLEDVNS